MKEKLRKIADMLERFGYFKYASTMDKVAEMLPEVGKSAAHAYSALGFDINNRANISLDQLKEVARKKIFETHPDRVGEPLMTTKENHAKWMKQKEEANHNTRILIDAMKIAIADLKKYKATGTGLGAGEEGGIFESDFYKWQEKAPELDAMVQQLADQLRKTRTMYMHVKRQEKESEEFGEDDEKVQKYRQRIESKKNKFENQEVFWFTTQIPREYDPYDYRRSERPSPYVRLQVDLAAKKILDLSRIEWGKNTIRKNEVASYKNKYVGQTVTDAFIERAKKESIDQELLNINKRKQELLSKKRVQEIGGEKAVTVPDEGIYDMLLEDIPKVDHVANLVNIGIQSGALRKLEKGERKGELTVEDVGTTTLFKTGNVLYEFSAAVFDYIKSMVKGTMSSVRYHAEDIVKFLLFKKLGISDINDFIKKYYGEDLGKYEYSRIIEQDPEKYKAAVDLEKRKESLESLVELRIKEYAHAIAQLYRTAGMSQYYDPDTFARTGGRDLLSQLYNQLTDMRRESYEKTKAKAQEALGMGKSIFDVDDYAEHMETNKEEIDSRLGDFYKQKETGEQKQSFEKAGVMVEEINKLKDSEEYFGLDYIRIPGGPRNVALEAEPFNRLIKYYFKKIMDLPIWTPELISVTKNRVNVLEKAKELLTKQYDRLDKWSRDNIKHNISFMRNVDITTDFKKEKEMPGAVEFWNPLYKILGGLLKSIDAYFQREEIVLGEPPTAETRPMEPGAVSTGAPVPGDENTVYLKPETVQGRYGPFTILKATGATRKAKDIIQKHNGKFFGRGGEAYWSLKPAVKDALKADLEAAGFNVAA